MISSGTLLLRSSSLPSLYSPPPPPPPPSGRGQAFSCRGRWQCLFPLHTHPQRKEAHVASFALKDGDRQQQVLKKEEEQKGRSAALAQQILLWAAETVYVVWLFLLPFAPGDPVWAIKPDTVNSLLGLSLNFFFILPFANAVGIHVLEAPVLHPVSEGLFNFVIGWTLMFAPLLYTDCKGDRFRGSLDLLWGFQMFLTNTFLIPYMAFRLDDNDSNYAPRKLSKLSSVMTAGAPIVGLVGGTVCLLSTWWAISGRGGGGFGSLEDRLDFFWSYIGSERLAYAFIWDICLYSVFQPWLISENLQNVQESKEGIVSILQYIPVVGLVAYLLSLNYDREF